MQLHVDACFAGINRYMWYLFSSFISSALLLIRSELSSILQYFLLPVLLSPRMLSSILSNALYGASIIWYAYITHLGYRGKPCQSWCSMRWDCSPVMYSFYLFSALPFLGNTQVFVWYPIIAVSLALVLSIALLVLGLHVNVTRIVMAFHYG